jgi:hypothetical protein
VARHASTWTHTVVLDWSATAKALDREAPRRDLLCFGSSLVKFGILPRTIEECTGLRGYNLALLNGPPPASYFLLRRALARGARPSLVIVDFDHNRLEQDPRSGTFNYPWADLLTTTEAFDLARATRDPALFGRVVAGSCLPSVRRRHEVRFALMYKLNAWYTYALDDVTAGFGSKQAFQRNRRVNLGAVVNRSVSNAQAQPVPNVVNDRSATWRFHPINAHYVKRFLALCGAHKIAVLWLVPPVNPAQQVLDDREGALARCLRASRQLIEDYPFVTIVDGRHAGFPAPVYIDHVHLDRQGSVALSRALASLVPDAFRPAANRWLELPRFQPPIQAELVEDLHQSELALRPVPGRARR